MKNDERCAYGQTARSAFFRGVEPEAARNALAARGAKGAGHLKVAPTTDQDSRKALVIG
jgi:hypothetical protein